MTFENETDRERRRKSDVIQDSEPPRSAKKRPPPSNVGNALRSVYQRAVDEDVPPEMLDLLGKLS